MTDADSTTWITTRDLAGELDALEDHAPKADDGFQDGIEFAVHRLRQEYDLE